jgi:Plasmid replication region DNA-binding N-term
MNRNATPSSPLGRPTRGVREIDVTRTADALLREGERPTVEKIRAKLGTGSPNTINPLLDQWWKGLAGRLENAPKALARLPEEVIHVAESLWHACLDQARFAAKSEFTSKTAQIDSQHLKQQLRHEALKAREFELEKRLSDRDQTIGLLESEIKTFAQLFKKEQLKSASQLQRIEALHGEIESLQKLLGSLSSARSVKNYLKQDAISARKKTSTVRKQAKVTHGLTLKKVEKRLANQQRVSSARKVSTNR